MLVKGLFLFKRGVKMKNMNHADPVNALAAQKQRDNRITACCDIFKGIVRANKTFLYAQIINYLLLAYSIFWCVFTSKELFRLTAAMLFPLAALAVTVIKRDIKGNLAAAGIDVVSIAVLLYFRAFDALSVLFMLASFIIHAMRAEKLYCHSKIKNLYGYSRFNSFDICNQVLGDDSLTDSIIASYEDAFDDRVMKFERSSHYVPPLFKKLQLVSMIAVLAGVVAAVFASAAIGSAKNAVRVDSIKDRKEGTVKGKVTQIFDVDSIGLDSATDSTYWVTFGGEQVCFSVPQSYKDKFESLFRYQHPGDYDIDNDSVKPSSNPIEFTGEIVKADSSKYAQSSIEPSQRAKEGSALAFNTGYYIKVYSTAFYNTLQKIGIALIIIGAIVWAGTILLGSLENKRY